MCHRPSVVAVGVAPNSHSSRIPRRNADATLLGAVILFRVGSRCGTRSRFGSRSRGGAGGGAGGACSPVLLPVLVALTVTEVLLG
jgi:hypothetical protein